MLDSPSMSVSCCTCYMFCCPCSLCELLVLVPFLPCLKVLIASIVIGCAIPPFDLWWLKSFTVISCSLVYWSRAWYVTSSHLSFDLTHFYTSKCLVAWNRSSVLHTSFSSVVYWHLSTKFLICSSSWSVDSLFLCFISLYIIDVVPVGGQDFKGVCYGLENCLWILLGLLICGDR